MHIQVQVRTSFFIFISCMSQKMTDFHVDQGWNKFLEFPFVSFKLRSQNLRPYNNVTSGVAQ